MTGVAAMEGRHLRQLRKQGESGWGEPGVRQRRLQGEKWDHDKHRGKAEYRLSQRAQE